MSLFHSSTKQVISLSSDDGHVLLVFIRELQQFSLQFTTAAIFCSVYASSNFLFSLRQQQSSVQFTAAAIFSSVDSGICIHNANKSPMFS